MRISDLEILFGHHPQLAAVRKALAHTDAHILLSGLHASARAMALRQIGAPLFVIFDNPEAAQYLYADLKTLKADVQFFPAAQKRRSVDEAASIQRTETLTALAGKNTSIVVTYPEAIAEPVPAQQELTSRSMTLRVGQEIQQSAISQQLSELGFEHVDFVFQPGQYAVRGSIVDIYSYSHDNPYRLDFFGDEIDSIREFDIEDQLSKNKVDSAEIVGSPNGEHSANEALITDYLTEEFVWVSNSWQVADYKGNGLGLPRNTLDLHRRRTIEIGEKSSLTESAKGKDVKSEDLKGKREDSKSEDLKGKEEKRVPVVCTEIGFNISPQPVFHKQFDILTEDLRKHIEEGYTVYVLAEQQKQLDRLKAIFESLEPSEFSSQISFTPINATLHEGFVDKELKICCYTDHQIFERFHRVTMTSENARRGKAIITLREINQLQVGDYVVHSDHGIAKFGGLVTTPVNGKPQEMIKLNYRDGANVFVSIHNLHRISKYKGREGSEPTIARLGSGAWERLKERTKDKIKDIARDLIRLYATRKQQKGFAYSPDGYMQHELEASFLYEDTPDQAKATADVKRDLESPMPMDRLVCGDVGFGKTEVAMRAAFKVATDGKQVAVLVPTTVLALQHYNTFRERMKNLPVRIEYLSRLKSPKEIKELLADLEAGKIDILIGTHKLIGKGVKWHDLGLLIIDEEQKFGVAAKEKLKSLRTNIDVLTLTATPIPRTLQFSLLGARDLSVMTTPPPNRYPVQTELITIDDEDLIKEAIDLEMGRNGQIFIVNNRIEMLPRIERRIHKLCPEARIITAHGQLPAGEMEERLEAFINYDYDILLSTTIIESGVDIPNVNTILIFSADKYGLADLHQLRGRVGRSNRKAYCYLIAPEKELLTEEARRRLEALSTFAELGAGFSLAMQDLDIRGAGNMLGSEQSGFIADLGYETYQRILNEAVEELKEEEGLGNDEMSATTSLNDGMMGAQRLWCADSQLETDLPICFPTDYIENISERITLYRELDNLRSEEQLLDFRKRLIDRFGVLPEPAEELLSVVRLRWICCRLGVEKILLKGERLTMYLVQNKDAYWQSEQFGRIIQYAATRPERCLLHEEKDKKGLPTGRRMVTITNVKTIGGAIKLLSLIETLNS